MPAETGQISLGSAVPFARGKAIGTRGPVDAGGKIWAAERAAQAHFASRFEALFCESFTRRRGGFASCAGITWAQRCEHDADLHACGSGEAESHPSEVSP